MKKVIAIMMVLAIVAGFVFADDISNSTPETHTIVIKGSVDEVLPAFSLVFRNSATNSSAKEFLDANGAPYQVGSTTANQEAGEAVTFKLDGTGTVVVNANVINDVKTNHKFELEFTGGVFTVKRNTVEGKYSPTKITIENGDTNPAIKIYGTAVDSSTNDTVTADTTSTLKAKTDVTFSGKKGTGSTTAITVATATYHYAGDDTIDPTETGKYYYASIVLTVTAK